LASKVSNYIMGSHFVVNFPYADVLSEESYVQSDYSSFHKKNEH